MGLTSAIELDLSYVDLVIAAMNPNVLDRGDRQDNVIIGSRSSLSAQAMKT
jgi:hypothetical protein